MVSVKERRELALIFGAVILVVIVGIVVMFIGARENVAGSAVDINVNQPNYAGFIHILENNGEWVPAQSSLSCDEVCGDRVCVPLQHTCSDFSIDYCRCYEVPQ